jgi:uncharacterized membrane protein
MSSVHKSIDVNVPVTTAYNQWTQFESFPQFMDGVESVTQLGDTRTHWVVKVAGAEREFDADIVEQSPDEVIAWASTSGDTGGHGGRVTFEPLGADSTRVDIELGWEPEGVVENVGAALDIDQRQVDKSASEFKRFIEDRGAETGAWRGDVGPDGSASAV